jgi:hypothetical protein
MTQGDSLLSQLKDIEDAVDAHGLCVSARMIAKLETDEQETVIHLLMETNVSIARIGNALRAHGYKLGDNSLWKHRRKTCACVVTQ